MPTLQLEILREATAAFQRQANIPVEVVEQYPGPVDQLVDAVIRVHFPHQTNEFLVEVKPTLAHVAVGQLAHMFARNDKTWILVTRYVYPALAQMLRDAGVQFIDTAGNAYINQPPAFIFIQANKRPTQDKRDGEEGMMGRGGIKLLFALLCKPELLNGAYREIAEAANVALGTAAGVLKELLREGYVVELGDKRRLNRLDELLNKWTTAYAERLRPKNFIGRFTANRPDFWQNEDVGRFGALWGGEIAAYRLTRYLKPEVTTIYARKPINEVLLNLKLRKDEAGDVVIRERFWNFDINGPDRNIVPPLLVYADLMATADARNIQTAKMILNEYLQRYIG